VLEEIARNKRRSVLAIAAFFLVWVGLGALVGYLASGTGKVHHVQHCTTFAQLPSGPVQNCETETIRDGSPPSVAIPTGATVAAFLAIGATVFALTSGSRLVLKAVGAHPANGPQYAQLRNVVEEMTIAAGLPKPDVYVIDDPSPNAFATGLSPNALPSQPPLGCSR
jgi:Zn-dependent protease with chaperone function